jgi:hypothetical protein
VPVVRGPKPPDPPDPPKRDYEEFDQFAALGDQLVKACDQIERECKTINEVLDAGNVPSDSLIKSAERWLARQDEYARRVKQFQEWDAYYNRPEQYEGHYGRIKRRVVSEAVALLIGSFPHANPHEPKCYSRMMVEEIYACKPNAIILESACRHIRRTEEFMPAPARMIKAIDQECSRWCDRFDIGNTGGDGCRVEYVFEELKTALDRAQARAIDKAKAKAAPNDRPM